VFAMNFPVSRCTSAAPPVSTARTRSRLPLEVGPGRCQVTCSERAVLGLPYRARRGPRSGIPNSVERPRGRPL
jgi:hypothetical protein